LSNHHTFCCRRRRCDTQYTRIIYYCHVTRTTLHGRRVHVMCTELRRRSLYRSRRGPNRRRFIFRLVSRATCVIASSCASAYIECARNDGGTNAEEKRNACACIYYIRRRRRHRFRVSESSVLIIFHRS